MVKNFYLLILPLDYYLGGFFMADFFDYLNWRGDLSFDDVPFNKIDALLLAHVTYSIFDGVVPENFTEKKTFAQVAKDFMAMPDYEEYR